MAGAILLLLTGTQILDWWWPLVLFIAGAGISAWRTRKLMPSAYAVAQAVDRKLDLKDSISTAFHFQQPAAREGAPELIAAQCQLAEETASGIAAGSAVPWRAPRQLMPALVLCGVAAGLFVVRYGTSGRLDLSKPIVEAVSDFFQVASEKSMAANRKAPKLPGQDPLGIDINQPDQGAEKLDQATENALDVVDTPDPNAGTEEAKLQQQQVKAAGDKPGDDQSESTEEGDRSSSAPNEKSADGETGKSGDQVAKDQKADQASKQSGGENSSLMDKMRDAMANLMAKLKIPQQQGTGQKQQASNQKGGQKQQGDQQQQGGQGQKGEKGQGNPQGKGSPSDDPDSKGDQQGEQQAQAGQGQSNDKGQEGGSPNEAKAGMGKQDGSKDIKDAEQQAAMGKLSEIYGKRAENIRGDVMVEVTSSKQQQLRTGYTQKGAAHGDSGGEVHRDEIPQHLQHYVQQYFEQVRKGESTAAATSPQTPAAAAPKPVQP